MNRPREDFDESPRGRQAAWRATALAAALSVFGELYFTIFFDRQLDLGQHVTIARYGNVLVALVVLVVAYVSRRRSARLAQVAFVALTLPLFAVLWIAEDELAASGQPIGPYVAYDFVIIGIALLAPGRASVGAALIVTLALQALIAWEALGFGSRLGIAATTQLSVLGFYTVVGIVLLAYRARHRQLLAAHERAVASARTMQELARVALAVRDMSNTPLQNLVLAMALLARKHQSVEHVTEPTARAVARLHELSRILSRYERWFEWESATESFDPAEVLAEVQARLEAGRAEPT